MEMVAALMLGLIGLVAGWFEFVRPASGERGLISSLKRVRFAGWCIGVLVLVLTGVIAAGSRAAVRQATEQANRTNEIQAQLSDSFDRFDLMAADSSRRERELSGRIDQLVEEVDRASARLVSVQDLASEERTELLRLLGDAREERDEARRELEEALARSDAEQLRRFDAQDRVMRPMRDQAIEDQIIAGMVEAVFVDTDRKFELFEQGWKYFPIERGGTERMYLISPQHPEFARNRPLR